MTLRSSPVLAVLFALCGAWPVAAFEPELPAGARLTAERATPIDSFNAPVAPFDGRLVPSVTVEGAIERRAWRIDSPGLTELQVMLPLRDQLEADGYDLRFECEAQTCGGFDFRFNTEVLPGPNMYVNISRFRYLTALRGAPDAPEKVVGILASVTSGAAYVQVISASTDLSPPDVPPEVRENADAPAHEKDAEGLGKALMSDGRVILEDLEFATGTSDLGAGPYASLAELAAFLASDPDLRIALVGHTDVVGALGTNIAISRARAQSVRARLISDFEADPARLEAEGMGYLSPIAPNLTEEGRSRNRRVEAVLLNTE